MPPPVYRSAPPAVRKPSTVGRNSALILAFFMVLALPAVAVGGMAITQRWIVPEASQTVAPSVFITPTPKPLPIPDAADPAPQCLADALGQVKAQSGTMTGQVRGVPSDAVLWDNNANKPQQPASNEKLLTALALVDALGAGALETTYTTSVVTPSNNRIILVGGGDPYLASSSKTAKLGQPATLADLAKSTAQALQASGQTSVSLGFDASAFTGPSWNPNWHADDNVDVTDVSALWADQGRTPASNGTVPHVGSKTPAADAAKLFAAQLKTQGIKVTSVDNTSSAAPAGAKVVASIQSLPLRAILSHALLVSDNSAMEVLLRHLAITDGKPATFKDGAAAVESWLVGLGLGAPGLNIDDGCGLARSNEVPAATLAGAVAWAGAQEGPVREVLTLLPVAGVSGSLSARFQVTASAGARGLVRAKTGTLNNVSTLTGYTVTDQGQVLAFTFMIGNSPQATSDRTGWLDKLAATLTTSRC